MSLNLWHVIRVICLVCLPLGLPELWAQDRRLHVFVADFQSTNLDAALLTRVSDEFETVVSEAGTYELLERRRIGDVRDAVKNEAVLRSDPDLVRRLRSKGAEAVLFGRLEHDVDDGSYSFYASLVRLDSTSVWKRTPSLSKPLINSRPHRMDALRSLLTGTASAVPSRNDPPAGAKAPPQSGSWSSRTAPSRITLRFQQLPGWNRTPMPSGDLMLVGPSSAPVYGAKIIIEPSEPFSGDLRERMESELSKASAFDVTPMQDFSAAAGVPAFMVGGKMRDEVGRVEHFYYFAANSAGKLEEITYLQPYSYSLEEQHLKIFLEFLSRVTF